MGIKSVQVDRRVRILNPNLSLQDSTTNRVVSRDDVPLREIINSSYSIDAVESLHARHLPALKQYLYDVLAFVCHIIAYFGEALHMCQRTAYALSL